MTNPMHGNMLACYPAVIERLQKIDGIKAVREVQDLQDILTAKRNIAPIDGAVYVVFDGMTPQTTAGNKQFLSEEISFSFILVKQTYRHEQDLSAIGTTLTAIKTAFQGFAPQTADGHFLTASAFSQRAAMPIEYVDGFAFFPIRFITTVAICGNPK